jgi:hypothetical protein
MISRPQIQEDSDELNELCECAEEGKSIMSPWLADKRKDSIYADSGHAISHTH